MIGRTHESAQAPVVHVGDTAGIPKLLVKGLLRGGYDAVNAVPLARFPNSSSTVKALTAWLRIWDAHQMMKSSAVGRRGILHVHYATAAVNYATVRTPLVVHCHGTDVRDARGVRRQVLQRIFRKSALVLAATPDLREYVPEAVYLPNPIDTELFGASGEAQLDVLVFAPLTAVKGADSLVTAVADLRRRVPGISVTALDIGPLANEMREAGATLIPRQDPTAIPRLIANHKIVIGQQRIGVLGVSELQALAAGKPTICFLDPDWYDGDEPPVQSSRSADDIVRLTIELLEDEERRFISGIEGRAWVERIHSLDVVTKLLVGHYRDAGILPDRHDPKSADQL